MKRAGAALIAGICSGVYVWAMPVAAQEIDHAAQYAACMQLTQIQPEEAFESALAWESKGGGNAARHCGDVALIGLGQYEKAAQRLEELAQNMTDSPASLRADVLAQAAQAWLLLGNVDRSYAVLTAALKLDPENVELLIDRSVTLATAARYWDAIDDLNRAAELSPEREDILIFRATAYRYLDTYELAQEDIARALSLRPENAEALLERGILRRLSGDEAGARLDWLAAARLAEGTPTGDAAQKNLENLDVKVE
jgi:tetratricopeptide (TPR) repeat protein